MTAGILYRAESAAAIEIAATLYHSDEVGNNSRNRSGGSQAGAGLDRAADAEIFFLPAALASYNA